MAPLTEPNPHEEIDVDAVRRHLRRAVDRLLALQDPAGYWCGELEGDSILESEYILLKWIIRQEHDQRLPAIADYLRWLQQPECWNYRTEPPGRSSAKWRPRRAYRWSPRHRVAPRAVERRSPPMRKRCSPPSTAWQTQR